MGIYDRNVWYNNLTMYLHKEFDFGTGVPVLYWKITGFAVDYEARIFTMRLRGWTSDHLFETGKIPLGTVELEFSDRKRKQMREMYLSAVAEGVKVGPFDDTGYAFDARVNNVSFTETYLYDLATMHPDMAGAEVRQESE